MVAILLGEHAAAVFLHVEAQLPGPLVSGPEVGAEVPVQKLHAILPGVPLRRPGDAVVVLIGAGQQRGGESGEAVLRGVL